jgi:DNA-binding MarR family transcriptional regulator
MKVILQKLRKQEDSDYLVAERYYTLLSAINDLKLTTREIQLIAFTAIKGNISYANIRQEFCKKYGTTNPSINNIISRLKKMGVLVKDGGKVKVNSKIVLNFENDITLEIRLIHG